MSLSLRRGEILAVAGVAGNGQKELVEMLTGLREPAGGVLSILGRDWKGFFHAPVRRKDGLVYIPEDRKGLATCPALNLIDNFVLTNRRSFTNGPFMDWKRGEAATRDAIREYSVQPPDPSVPAGSLSGGNLQKLVIAREFYRRPRLIVAENPTQGLDISAMEEVWRRILAAREHAGILLVTSDLSEAVTLADTFAVMYGGRFIDVFPRDDAAKVNAIGLMLAGIKPEEHDGGRRPEHEKAVERMAPGRGKRRELLFELNSGRQGVLAMRSRPGCPAHLPMREKKLLREWYAFVHAAVLYGLMVQAPEYRRGGIPAWHAGHSGGLGFTPDEATTLLWTTPSRLCGPSVRTRTEECPGIFFRRLSGKEVSEVPPRQVAVISGVMAMILAAVLDKLEQYEFLTQ